MSKDIQQGWFYIFVEAFRAAASWPGGHFLIAVSEKIIQLTISYKTFTKYSADNIIKLLQIGPNNIQTTFICAVQKLVKCETLVSPLTVQLDKSLLENARSNIYQ